MPRVISMRFSTRAAMHSSAASGSVATTRAGLAGGFMSTTSTPRSAAATTSGAASRPGSSVWSGMAPLLLSASRIPRASTPGRKCGNSLIVCPDSFSHWSLLPAKTVRRSSRRPSMSQSSIGLRPSTSALSHASSTIHSMYRSSLALSGCWPSSRTLRRTLYMASLWPSMIRSVSYVDVLCVAWKSSMDAWIPASCLSTTSEKSGVSSSIPDQSHTDDDAHPGQYTAMSSSSIERQKMVEPGSPCRPARPRSWLSTLRLSWRAVPMT
mmetsp:Transcript_3401/g.13863  ORF Transcript_3401/g.13863 Transcript_3401/m.13863 type:complete len:267 (+) Transcript_3401:757-1557(+)